MTKSTCPYCTSQVGYWSKLKPVLGLKQKFVTCPHCDREVSDFWIKSGGWLTIGAGSAIYLFGQMGNPFLSVPFGVLIVLLGILLVPLCIEPSECDPQQTYKDKEEYLAKETEFSGKRAILLALICIAVLAGMFALV